jgi:drug/metabolite transporter (DMT)-like permease
LKHLLLHSIVNKNNIWSLVPLVVTFCAGVPLFPFLSIVCFVTFGTFLISWLIKGESPVANLRMPFGRLIIVTLGNGLSRGLFWSSLLLINPVEAALIGNLWAMMAVVAGVLVAGHGLQGRHWLGIAAGLSGIVVLTSGTGGILAALTPMHVMALGGGIVWSGYTALARQDQRYAGNAVATGYLMSGVIYLILALATGSSWEIGPVSLGFILLAGTAGSAGSFIWDIGTRYGHEQAIGKVALALPLLSACWLITEGRSQLELHIMIGALLVFAAAAIVSPYVRQRNIIVITDQD